MTTREESHRQPYSGNVCLRFEMIDRSYAGQLTSPDVYNSPDQSRTEYPHSIPLSEPRCQKKNEDEWILELSNQECELIRPLRGLQKIRAIAGELLPGFLTAQFFLGRSKVLEYLGRRDAPEGRSELVHTDC